MNKSESIYWCASTFAPFPSNLNRFIFVYEDRPIQKYKSAIRIKSNM